MNKINKQVLLTFDIEEWFQVENLKSAVSRGDWDKKQSSVEQNVDKILELLAEYSVPATFFILGWVAERHPEMIRKIHRNGHEIACHGYGHELTTKLERATLSADIDRARSILEDITGESVVGYRAPSFSVSDTLIELLLEKNFQYDASFNPFSLNNRYGTISKKMVSLENGIYLIDDRLYEIPISTAKIVRMNLPIGGGAYFRIIPFWFFKYMVHKILSTEKFYSFYLHPWEFEPDQERVVDIKLNYKFRHYFGLDKTEIRLKKLIESLKSFSVHFVTAKDFILSHAESTQPA